MTLVPLEFRPGIVRERTRYSNKGGWYHGDKVRFRDGLPEKIGGWTRFTRSAFVGTARSLFGWATLDSDKLYGLGTNVKFYLIQGGGLVDITPLRRTVTLTSDPFTTTSPGSTLVNVFDNDHGANAGNYVTFSGATGPVDGIPADDFNQEFSIVEVVDSDNYTIDVATAATAGSVAGGGAAVVAAYQIYPGLNTTVEGVGWGAGGWGEGGWGDPADELTTGEILRLWYQDNFGEDLIFNIQGGDIYYKDVSEGLGTAAVALNSLAGAVDVPIAATQVLVSNNDRHVIAFGCNDIGSTVVDPSLIRWANRENAVDWNQLNNVNGEAPTAGSLRLNVGSGILRAVETQREILVWTDVSLHSLRFLGSSSFTFGQELVGADTSLIAPNAIAVNGSVVYWMGHGVFYKWDGRVQELKCDIEEYVFRDLTEAQHEKITAGVNRANSEIWFFMPRGDDSTAENNFYVVYNYRDETWYYGTMNRTAWIDAQFESRPLAAGDDGYVYLQEDGYDDGSTSPASPMNSFVESSLTEIGEGDRFMFVRKLIPDVTFVGSTSESPQVTIEITPRNYPGGPQRSSADSEIARSVKIPVEQYDAFKSIRLRGRMITYRVSSDRLGVAWRHGIPRLDARELAKR